MAESRMLTDQGERVETGPVHFGEDWPGTFIRGDNGMAYVLALDGVLSGKPAPFDELLVRNLRDLLAGSLIGPIGAMLAKRRGE